MYSCRLLSQDHHKFLPLHWCATLQNENHFIQQMFPQSTIQSSGQNCYHWMKGLMIVINFIWSAVDNWSVEEVRKAFGNQKTLSGRHSTVDAQQKFTAILFWYSLQFLNWPSSAVIGPYNCPKKKKTKWSWLAS